MMRLPSLVAGVLMIPACYLLARRLYGKDAAVLSALLVAVFPVIVRYSVLARGYITISLFTVLIFLLGDYVRENKNRLAWLLLIVFSALGLYTIPIMLYSVGALHVWLFMVCLFGDFASYRTRVDFMRYWLASGVATTFLTTVLYLPIFLNRSNPLAKNQFLTPVEWALYPSVLWQRLTETWVDWTSSIPGWMIVLGVFGLFLSLVLHHKIARQKVPTQIAFFIWVAGFIILRRPIMEMRMWTFLAAPLLIWSAGGLIGSLKLLAGQLNIKWQLSQLASNMILVFVLVLGVLTIRTIPQRWQQKSNIENTVLYLKSHLKEGDMVASSIGFRPQLQYYFVVYDIPSVYLHPSGSFERAFVVVRSVGWSANAGDTLEATAPRNASGSPAINVATAKVLQQYEDLTLYEGYPYP
jgi:4-amino-4-deoxy-L-arabinose transferase-like glycosyltransferase